MYVYVKSEPSLWTVGFYEPDGTWRPESDHGNKDDAADRVHFLNGGNPDGPTHNLGIPDMDNPPAVDD